MLCGSDHKAKFDSHAGMCDSMEITLIAAYVLLAKSQSGKRERWLWFWKL
jgi:hypothetical protein